MSTEKYFMIGIIIVNYPKLVQKFAKIKLTKINLTKIKGHQIFAHYGNLQHPHIHALYIRSGYYQGKC